MAQATKRWVVVTRYPEEGAPNKHLVQVSARSAGEAISRGYAKLLTGVARFQPVEDAKYADEIATGYLLPTREYARADGRLVRCELGIGVDPNNPRDGGSAAFNVLAFERGAF